MRSIALIDVDDRDPGVHQLTIARALRSRSVQVHVVQPDDASTVRTADAMIVAGKHDGPDVVKRLGQGRIEAIRAMVKAGKPVLITGAALSIAFDKMPGGEGLSLLRGAVHPLPFEHDVMRRQRLKIPHVGWNRILLEGRGHELITAMGKPGTWVYFAHRHHVVLDDPSTMVASTDFGRVRLVAALAQENVFGTQFMPERSHRAGELLLTRFVSGW